MMTKIEVSTLRLAKVTLIFAFLTLLAIGGILIAIILTAVLPDGFRLPSSFSEIMSSNYYSGMITIVVSLLALALPLSINAITSNQDRRFSNNELAESLYGNPWYRIVKHSFWLLMIILIASFFDNPNLTVTALLSVLAIGLLVVFIRFMNIVESYVSNFPGILISEEKSKIERILDGKAWRDKRIA